METLFIGKNSIFLPETESTNSYAIHLLKNVNLIEGSVVHTAHQTHGKGQRGNRWLAEPLSNLCASIVLKPTFLELKNQFFLYQITALACHDTLSELLAYRQYDIKIKWPNDILVDRKKIAGILIENNLQGTVINWSVAGIGINVNQDEFSGISTATSLKLLTGTDHSVHAVLDILCRHLEKYYLQLKSGKFESIRQAYLENLYGLSETLEFEVNDTIRKLYVKGVSNSGLLNLLDEDGKLMEADVKQVKWIY